MAVLVSARLLEGIFIFTKRIKHSISCIKHYRSFITDFRGKMCREKSHNHQRIRISQGLKKNERRMWRTMIDVQEQHRISNLIKTVCQPGVIGQQPNSVQCVALQQSFLNFQQRTRRCEKQQLTLKVSILSCSPFPQQVLDQFLYKFCCLLNDS